MTPPLIPLFPLGLVLVPGLVLPLHIFEPRYRLLIRRLTALPPDEQEFGVVAILQGQEVGPAATRLADVGTTAVLREVETLDDGRFEIVTTGARRFRILGTDDREPYLQAHVEFLDEPLGDGSVAATESVRRQFHDYRIATGSLADDTSADPDLPDDPTVLSYLVAAAVVADVPTRQSLLEVPDTASRLRTEIDLLRSETAIIRHLGMLPATDLETGWTAN